jgi:hypothetical protein
MELNNGLKVGDRCSCSNLSRFGVIPEPVEIVEIYKEDDQFSGKKLENVRVRSLETGLEYDVWGYSCESPGAIGVMLDIYEQRIASLRKHLLQ